MGPKPIRDRGRGSGGPGSGVGGSGVRWVRGPVDSGPVGSGSDGLRVQWVGVVRWVRGSGLAA